MNTALPEIDDFTSEQRRVLARAYRLILSWPRGEHQVVQAQAADINTSPTCVSGHDDPKAKPSSKAKGDRQSA